MIPFRYAYFTGTILFFIPWVILFIKRKDLRKEMIIMGIIGAFGSLATAYFWTIDWWRPQTITGTRIGIEDFILGVTNGGIAAVLYDEVFRKRLYKTRPSHSKSLILLIVLTVVIFFVLLFSVQVGSFISCIVSLIIFCGILILLRKDLLFSSTINGCLMTIIALPVYYSMMLLSPGVIEKTYVLNSLSGVRVTGIPLEELVFYAIFGFMVTLLYEYWQGLSLRNLSQIRSKKSQRS